MSVNQQNQTRWLWSEMSKNICKGEGRVMMNKDGVVASLFSDSKNHTVYSNSWKKTSSNRPTIQQSEAKSDHQNSQNESSESESESDRSGDEKEGAEWEVKKILERKKEGKGYKYKTLWSTEETTWEIFSSFVDEERFSQPFFQFATETDWNCGLVTFSQQKLKCIATFLGLSRCMYFFETFFYLFFFQLEQNQS